jgi:hypothetical protein
MPVSPNQTRTKYTNQLFLNWEEGVVPLGPLGIGWLLLFCRAGNLTLSTLTVQEGLGTREDGLATREEGLAYKPEENDYTARSHTVQALYELRVDR